MAALEEVTGLVEEMEVNGEAITQLVQYASDPAMCAAILQTEVLTKINSILADSDAEFADVANTAALLKKLLHDSVRTTQSGRAFTYSLFHPAYLASICMSSTGNQGKPDIQRHNTAACCSHCPSQHCVPCKHHQYILIKLS